MKTSLAIKLAVSTATIAATMVACIPAAMALRPTFSADAAPKAARQAHDFYARAQAAAQKGDTAGALAAAEQAVEAAPRDAGYRMLLADLYLKSGRFDSARTTFGDVLALDAGNSRAALAVVLTDIALGRKAQAVTELDSLSQTAQPADVGLAYALAGQPQRAVELLEPAARAAGASGRTRQNLALAYALSGDWKKARLTAAQDVSPAELGSRLEQWAALAQPEAAADQVAALLGVKPAADSGQPTRLALAAPEAPASAYAAAEPAPAPAPPPAAANVVIAAAEPVPSAPEPQPAVESAQSDVPAWLASPQPAAQAAAPARQPVEETRPLYADAVESLVKPNAAVIRASAPIAPLRHFDTGSRRSFAPVHASASDAPGKFAVQLGAFNTPANVERAWAQAYKRYGFADHTPLSTTVIMPGRGTFHRLSVAGFDNRDEANRICQSVRARGGACFVRAVAGDAPVRWASRYAAPAHRG